MFFEHVIIQILVSASFKARIASKEIVLMKFKKRDIYIYIWNEIEIFMRTKEGKPENSIGKL